MWSTEYRVVHDMYIFVLFKDAIRFIHLLHAIYQEPSSTGTTSKAVPQLLYVV